MRIAAFTDAALGPPPPGAVPLRSALNKYLDGHAGETMTVPFLLVPLVPRFAQALHIPGDVFRVNDRDAEGPLVDILGREMTDRPETRPCRPRDLGALGRAVDKAVDPSGNDPLAVGRVQSTIDGIDVRGLGPPKLPLSFDFPAWTLLKTHARDWLLPGVDGLP